MGPVHKYELTKEHLHLCYEAGPTGFVLARRLIHLGFDCIAVTQKHVVVRRKAGDESTDMSISFMRQKTLALKSSSSALRARLLEPVLKHKKTGRNLFALLTKLQPYERQSSAAPPCASTSSPAFNGVG